MSVSLGLGRQQSERDFQGAVISFAQMQGYMVYHAHDSRRQVAPGKWIGDKDAAGFPDLVIVGHGRTLFVELKSEKGRVRPDQQIWLAWLKRHGQDARVWRPSSWPEIERTL